ncbi:unnamed protein product [Ixodes hexagonus]
MPQPERAKRQGNGGNKCCIGSCCNKSTDTKKVVFYTFPNEARFPGRRKLWQDAIRKSGLVDRDWKAPRNGRICNFHFQHRKKSDDPHDGDYVPSVFTARSKPPGHPKRRLARYEHAQELLARKKMLLQQLPDFFRNGTGEPVKDLKPAVKLETSSVGISCCLRLDTRSVDVVDFPVFTCFSDGRNVATQACLPGRRKFTDRGTQVGVGTLPPCDLGIDFGDGGPS